MQTSPNQFPPQAGFNVKKYLWETGVSSHNISLITKLSNTIQHKKTITQKTKIIEIASNDGSLLKVFSKDFKINYQAKDRKEYSLKVFFLAYVISIGIAFLLKISSLSYIGHYWGEVANLLFFMVFGVLSLFFLFWLQLLLITI